MSKEAEEALKQWMEKYSETCNPTELNTILENAKKKRTREVVADAPHHSHKKQKTESQPNLVDLTTESVKESKPAQEMLKRLVGQHEEQQRKTLVYSQTEFVQAKRIWERCQKMPNNSEQQSYMIDACKQFREKHKKPFPGNFKKFLEEDEHGVLKWDTDHVHVSGTNAKNRTFDLYEVEKDREWEVSEWTEPIVSAYILLFLRRIAEIAPEFPTLPVDEKLAVMVNAHNDPEHAYIWAGPLTASVLLEEDENECTNPVYQLTFPVQVQYTERHIGTKVVNMLEKYFQEDRHCNTNFRFYGPDADEVHQFVLGDHTPNWDRED
jgi:ribosomal protein S7